MSPSPYLDTPGIRRPIFPVLMSFSGACFIVTLITDVVYARSYNTTWETFSVWLLTIGLLAAALFVVIGLIEGLMRRRWPSALASLGYAVVLVLSIFNAFIHSRDGYTAVVPTGLAISIIVVVILLVTWFVEWASLKRRRIAA